MIRPELLGGEFQMDSSNEDYETIQLDRIARASRRYSFGAMRKTRQSIGGYASLFARKLLPPLGFYREADKYAHLKAKFRDDPEKLEALDEMWGDYQKYQVRKRFRWPPELICKKFFWTTGYYADYQKTHRATKLRQPGEDSSDEEEFFDPAGQFMIAGGAGGPDDINMEEFGRYKEAKKQAAHGYDPDLAPGQQRTRFGDNTQDSYLADRRPTVTRLFEDPKKEVEETETIVEYTLIRDPNKKKKDKKDKDKGKKKKQKFEDDAPDNISLDGIDLEELKAGGKKRIRKKSVATIDPKTGQKITQDIEDSSGDGDKKDKKKDKKKKK